jgi:hypothetical protein
MVRNYIKRKLREAGYIHINSDEKFHDMDEKFFEIYDHCKGYTLTSVERMYHLYSTVKYLTEYHIPGDFVECGVWKGGSIMLCSLTLQMLGDKERKLYLYDTYEGMSKPTEKDVNYLGSSAKDKWSHHERDSGKSDWCYASLEEVKSNVYETGYPIDNFILIKGKVEETIPGSAPESISLLRLDTDLYESTYHELKYLYPLLSNKGVLIVDDYGHWRGSKEATDRYIEELGQPVLLSRIDYAGRAAIKTT